MDGEGAELPESPGPESEEASDEELPELPRIRRWWLALGRAILLILALSGLGMLVIAVLVASGVTTWTEVNDKIGLLASSCGELCCLCCVGPFWFLGARHL